MSGKGSTPRPIPNREQYESNWDAILPVALFIGLKGFGVM